MGRVRGLTSFVLLSGLAGFAAAKDWDAVNPQQQGESLRLGKTQYFLAIGRGSNSAPEERKDLSIARRSRPASKRGNPMLGGESFNLSLVSATSVPGKSEQDLQLTSGLSKPVKSQPKTQKRRVLVFKASWCGACQGLNYEWPKLEAVNWRIGESDTNHIQLVDADARPDLMTKYGVYSLPTLVLVEDDREVSRRGALSAFDIAEMYYGRL